MTNAFADMDAIYDRYLRKERAPGLAAAVVAGGEIAHVVARGLADTGTGRPVDARTCFRIASMTKAVTALAILALRDAGRLRLDDPAALYSPEFGRVSLPTRDAAPVTIRDLLMHVAGLVTDDPWADRQLSLPPEALAALVSEGGLYARPPQTAFEYSNLGYAILGQVITRVAGQPYQAFITECLLAPLGMIDTTFDYRRLPEDRRATGYRRLGKDWFVEAPETDGAFGAMGGLWTTVTDYARYVAFLLQAWPARDAPESGPVRRSTIREVGSLFGPPLRGDVRRVGGAAEGVSTAYGYGLLRTNDPVIGHYLHHRGGLPGFGSHVLLSPEAGIGVFAFANLTYADVSIPDVDAALALARSGVWRLPTQPVSASLQRAAEAVALAYAAGSIEAASEHLASNLLLDEPAAVRDAALAALKMKFGAGELVRIEARHRLAGTLHLACTGGELAAEIVLTPGGAPLIQHLKFLTKA